MEAPDRGRDFSGPHMQAWALRAAPPGLAKAIVMRSLESATDESEEPEHEVQEADTQDQQTKVLKQWFCRTCRATVVGNRCPGCLHSSVRGAPKSFLTPLAAGLILFFWDSSVWPDMNQR